MKKYHIDVSGKTLLWNLLAYHGKIQEADLPRLGVQVQDYVSKRCPGVYFDLHDLGFAVCQDRILFGREDIGKGKVIRAIGNGEAFSVRFIDEVVNAQFPPEVRKVLREGVYSSG